MDEPATPPAPAGDLTAADLQTLARLLGLVAIPDQLLPRVLAAVQTYRAAMRRLDEAGIDLADIVTAQPFRADERGAAR